MTIHFDCYWSFRSPYSYLVTSRLAALVRDYDAECHVRIVRPLAVRQPDFFTRADPLWLSYLSLDVHRTADFVGVPYRMPRPDPVFMDPATRTYPAEQPHIHRLCRLGQLACERGAGLAFVEAFSHMIFSGTVDDWHLGTHMADAAARAGLDLAEMDMVLAREGDRLAAALEANEAAERAAGHYGVPTMVFAGEPFFGQDRFDQLLWRMRAGGLTARPSR